MSRQRSPAIDAARVYAAIGTCREEINKISGVAWGYPTRTAYAVDRRRELARHARRLGLSYPQIAKVIGYASHVSAMNACKGVEQGTLPRGYFL